MTKTKTVRAFNPTTRPAMMKRNAKGQFVSKKRRRSSSPNKRRRRRNPSYGAKRPRRRTTRRRAPNPSRPRRRRRTTARRTTRRRTSRRRNPQRITGRRVMREFQHLAIAGLAGGAASMGMDQAIGWLKRQAIKQGWLDGLAGGDTVRAGRIAEYGGDALTLVGAAILGVWAKGRVRNRAIANGLAYGPAAAAVSRLMQRVIAQAQTAGNNNNNAGNAPVLLGYQQPQSFPRIPASGTRGNLMDTLYWGAGDQDLRGYLFEGDTLVSGPTASDAAYTSF
jgi:hypothetical protein